MTTTEQQKAPVGVLADVTDEGLENPTPKEQENMTSLSAAVSTRLTFDEFTVIDVDPRGENVEVTFSTRDVFGDTRSTFGIALTPEEARNLASALLDGVAPAFGHADPEEVEEHAAVARKVPVNVPVSELAAGTVTDVFRWAQDHDMGVGDVMGVVEDYIDAMAEVESLTPAQFCKRQRQIMRGAQA